MSWRVRWSDEALKDMRRIDRPTRQRILNALDRFVETGQGDIVRLRPPLTDVRMNHVVYAREGFDRGTYYSYVVRRYLDFLPYLEVQRTAYRRSILNG